MTARCISWLAALALASTAGGQVQGAQFCGSNVYNESPNVRTSNPIERMHPLVSRGRYSAAVADEQWEAVLRTAREETMQAFVAAQVAPAHQAMFVAQLDSVIEVIPRLPPETNQARARFVADSVRPIRFHPVMGDRAFRLFRRADTISTAGLTDNQAKALCWSAMSVDAVLFRLQKPLEIASMARLARFNTAWANYRSYGYTRQPVELFLFRGSVRDTLPPKWQWLIGHLSVGAEVSGNFTDSLAAGYVTVVELGALRYRKNYTQYSGLSLIAGFSDNVNFGFGAMAHVARSLRAGVLLHRIGGEHSTNIVVSSDLYGLLERSKRSVDRGWGIARGIVVLPRPAGP